MKIEYYIVHHRANDVPFRSIHRLTVDLEDHLKEIVADWVDEEQENIEISSIDLRNCGVSLA